ncbi:hypothetical protein FPSE_07761 [Fusarium pseudograminearum CS3096]|uniref:Uncharacterized protein n=1 Tax=Fusarium pseudograminearum (strain CS3096) TaxID=1028729 RepID=K3VGI5_FUSPC|nr:hypothetical protein FPSE_07761 [Fusarium pseudograminearum CS3096]EKJ72058.1 hypothetical protein FPSE_07761 [Fusarium pseudograminearum CS3096]
MTRACRAPLSQQIRQFTLVKFEVYHLGSGARGYNGSPSKQHQCMTRGSSDLQPEAVSQAFTRKRSPLELDPEADALLICSVLTCNKFM